jgi:hypothetical protein
MAPGACDSGGAGVSPCLIIWERMDLRQRSFGAGPGGISSNGHGSYLGLGCRIRVALLAGQHQGRGEDAGAVGLCQHEVRRLSAACCVN